MMLIEKNAIGWCMRTLKCFAKSKTILKEKACVYKIYGLVFILILFITVALWI